MNDELFTRFGESKERVVADRKLIEDLFGNLYKNRIIYNERITILSEIVESPNTFIDASMYSADINAYFFSNSLSALRRNCGSIFIYLFAIKNRRLLRQLHLGKQRSKNPKPFRRN